VPTVTGEDVESVVRQYARQHEVPLLFLAMSPKSMHDVFRDLLVDRRKRFEAEAGPPDPRAVNLIGFTDERATREVADLLACLGVRVNCLLLPDLDLDRFRRLPEASLNVCLPNAVWKHHYDHLQRDSRTPAISPAGPFGRAGTRRWAVEVAKALGLDVDVDAAWAAYAARYDGEWTVAAARCAGKRLGLVVRGVDTRYLADPAETWGIPIVAMMEEAGFGLDVLLKVDDRDEARTRAGIVQGLFRDPARHALKGFNSFELMRQRLREAPCRAVFSQHVFDWRLTEAGKGRFSLQHFEMGLPGAIRTAARLASIAESPFFAAYGKYLGRTPEGLRLPVGGGS
jgi:nitrogenase molybdenum-iron protein alpha/beta subunit